MNSPSRVFAGWWVVAGAFLCMLTGYAAAYSFAAFFGALEGEFGARRGETALVFSIAAFLYFLLGFPGGLIADRIGPRRNHMIDHAHLLIAAHHTDATLNETIERLRAGVFVHDMQVRIKQDMFCIESRHRMGLDQLLVQRARHSASDSSCGGRVLPCVQAVSRVNTVYPVARTI